MNNEKMQGISPEERELARTLESIADEMQVSPAFEKSLEARLLQLHDQKQQPARSGIGRLLPAVGWVVAALLVVWVVNWGARSLNAQNAVPGSEIEEPAPAFIDQVQSGAI